MTTECKGEGGNIFTWAADKVDITEAYTGSGVKVDDTEANATFVMMDKNEICPDPTKPIKTKKQAKSASTQNRKRFKPKSRNITSFFNDPFFELMTDHEYRRPHEVIDRCFRLNGYFLTLPQNKEEEDLLDKLAWDYQMKKASNNLTYLIDKGSATWVFVAAGTENLDDNSEEKRLKELGVASNPRQSTYPVNENLDLFHLWTGAPIVNYREGFVLQQSRSFYKLPQQCLSYASSMKKPGVSWHKILSEL